MPLEISELPLVGGHPALDLVNTVESRARLDDEAPYDYLRSPADLVVWAARAGLVTPAETGLADGPADGVPAEVGGAALATAIEIREALHAVLLVVTGVDGPGLAGTDVALERLRQFWTAALGRSVLQIDGSAVQLQVGLAAHLLIPDRIAAAAMDLLLNGDLGRLRRCPPDEGGCGWIVLDNSRNGSRRWCRMGDCGTAVKAQRLTERRRARRSAGPVPSGSVPSGSRSLLPTKSLTEES